MLSENNTNRVLALGAIAAALLIAFVWVPLDTDTGMIEKVRRQVTIGDSLAPTLAAMFIGVGGLLLALQSGTVRDGYVTIGNLVASIAAWKLNRHVQIDRSVCKAKA